MCISHTELKTAISERQDEYTWSIFFGGGYTIQKYLCASISNCVKRDTLTLSDEMQVLQGWLKRQLWKRAYLIMWKISQAHEWMAISLAWHTLRHNGCWKVKRCTYNMFKESIHWLQLFILSAQTSLTGSVSKVRCVHIFQKQYSFTDEIIFMQEGAFNNHNQHLWTHINPHDTYPHVHKRRFFMNVWAGIIWDHLTGPYLLPGCLYIEMYQLFLQKVLRGLLEYVLTDILRRMCFQEGGAPYNFLWNVRNYFDRGFPERCIVWGGDVA